MKPDAELVAAAQAGDRDALDTLLRRHYDRVDAICRRVVGTGRDADDAAQEAMISIVRGLRSFDGRAAFTTWLYRIATNAALDEVRKRGRRPALHVVDDRPEEVDPMAHRQVDAVVDRLAVDEAVATLPPDFRAAVVLRDVCDLDYGEIAEILGVPVGTVKSRIARGRGHLIKALDGGNRGAPTERPTAAPSTDEPAP
jgi:RNA polymerase sigma-70 factor (ECF subfamily)